MAKKAEIVKKEQMSVNTDALFDKVSAIIEEGRKYVSTAVNLAEVFSKFQIGMYIVEDEQAGNKRADYGKQILLNLSERLTEKYGDGWSLPQLKLIRQFYIVYSKKINAVYPIQKNQKSKEIVADSERLNTVYQIQNLPKSLDPASMPRFTLSWSHYIVLMRIKNEEERRFYEIEALREHWSVRHLQRQYASSLYERLALSRDKEEVMRLSREGLQVAEPQDVIKNPVIAEFLGLKEHPSLHESTIEEAILSNPRILEP